MLNMETLMKGKMLHYDIIQHDTGGGGGGGGTPIYITCVYIGIYLETLIKSCDKILLKLWAHTPQIKLKNYNMAQGYTSTE